jgi:Helix-turn-helix.
MSQDEFAKALKVAFSTVNRWEAGRTRPNLFAMKQLRAFCKDNHISFEALEKAWLTESQGGE